MRHWAAPVAAMGIALMGGAAKAQTPAALAPFPVADGTALRITRDADPKQPFSVVGPRGALLGVQDGSLEAWVFPWKIFSDLRITAQAEGGEPVEMSTYAAKIDVTPSATTLTYRNAGLTVRQIMFAPQRAPDGAGAAILFQITSARPVTLTLRLAPRMQRMWPLTDAPTQQTEWVQAGGGGYYVLRNAATPTVGLLAMPQARPGTAAPPRTITLELHYEPERDGRKYFPLLMATTDATEGVVQKAALARLNRRLAALHAETAAHYHELLAQHARIETPDATLDAAYAWALAAMDAMKVETPEHKGKALTAGFGTSGDSTRPGFGWFFGRDSLWSIYAIDGYGDFATTREQIEFLLRHQRADGKIMHEYSQTANLVDWASLPYYYASADATPLLLMAANDYLNVSGDADFVREHWEELARAWTFETAHVSSDGIYNNTQGTGWVESWIPKMPFQEIYLAALDEQASLAYAQMARAVGEDNAATAASARAAKIGKAIEDEYYLPDAQFYAFSRNEDGTLDRTATIFPSVAWWDGTYALGRADAMMQRWASDEFSTDWGTRILSDQTSFYDPTAYHQGTVWPLYTGWVALAEYRAGRPLDGYTHLMENADMTWSRDPGTVTELLSGKSFTMMGTPHQLWSSAMVVTPVLRGIFGLEWDAATKTLTVTPQLPADWNSATVRRVPLGRERVDLRFTRRGQVLDVEATGGAGVRLASHAAGATAQGRSLQIPLPPVEVAVARHLPQPDAPTQQMKVLDERWGDHSLTLVLAAQGGTQETLTLRENAPELPLACMNGTLGDAKDGLRPVTVTFPPGSGYVTVTVTFSW
jgi:glycogen debranching enzyme